MLTRRQLLVLAVPGTVASGISACSRQDPTPAVTALAPSTTAFPTSPADATTPTTPQTGKDAAGDREAAYRGLDAALRAIDLPAYVSFGMALRDREAGLDFAYAANRQFETASIAKVDILAALLLRAQDRGTSLSGLQREQAERMIRLSSNDDAWDLWNDLGGKPGVDRANKRLGLAHTTTVTYSWGLMKTTPADQVRLIGRVATPSARLLTRASSSYALHLMRTVTPEQAWGVSAAARPGEVSAVKNGWLPRSVEGGRWIANSIGLVTGPGVDLRMAVLSRGHADYGRGIKLVERVARLARSHLYTD